MEKKYGFEVSLNGSKLARTGIQKEHYVISCILTAVHRKDGSSELTMTLGGLDSEAHQHVCWQDANLKVGDKITIEVIDGQFDPPLHKSTGYSEEQIRENKIKHYLQLKEELKDYLAE